MQSYKGVCDSFLSSFEVHVQKLLKKRWFISLNPGTVLSVVCLPLYSPGFIRIELKLNDHDQRLMAVEEVISQMKQRMADGHLE